MLDVKGVERKKERRKKERSRKEMVKIENAANVIYWTPKDMCTYLFQSIRPSLHPLSVASLFFNPSYYYSTPLFFVCCSTRAAIGVIGICCFPFHVYGHRFLFLIQHYSWYLINKDVFYEGWVNLCVPPDCSQHSCRFCFCSVLIGLQEEVKKVMMSWTKEPFIFFTQFYF